MPKYELLIACTSKYKPDFKEEGDIISVRLHPFNWGKTSRLIVLIEDDRDIQTMRTVYEIPLYEGGLDRHPPDDIDIMPKILRKNRFQLPYEIIKNGWFPSLNLEKVRDRQNVDQPLKKANIIIDTKEEVSLIWDKHKKSFKYPILGVAEIAR